MRASDARGSPGLAAAQVGPAARSVVRRARACIESESVDDRATNRISFGSGRLTRMHLYLLRHGESEGNVAGVFSGQRTNPPLSAAGHRQALAQAAVLAGLHVEALYASPLRRAQQTAARVGERTGIPVRTEPALLEVDVGELDGVDSYGGDAWARYEAVRRQWELGQEKAGFAGGETLADIRARLERFLGRLPDRRSGPVVLVGHGMIFMSLLWLFCENRAPTLQGNYMEKGHLSVLTGARRRYRICAFNTPPGVTPGVRPHAG